AKVASAVAGFAVAARVVVGNFSYAKLPMVLDLQTATDTLAASELICAIAGDEDARAAVRARHPNVSPSQPDTVPPADEFLVLDADASQSYAINCAVGGADLVIDGPPGTGKSQTIANLVAALSARGQRILFVAEKRAAIDAVLDRLDRAGLADLVLDLHEGAGSKRKLAADLARTLAIAAGIPKPDMTAGQEALVRHRRALAGRAEALHAPREPWGISVYDAHSGLSGIPATARSAQRLPAEALTRLDGRTFRQARADLESFIGLGGLAISAATSPWAGAFAAGTITTADAARAALDTARTLAGHTLRATTARLLQVLIDCGLSEPRTVQMWMDALGLLDGVAASLAVFDPAVFDAPVEELAAALAPARPGGFGRLAPPTWPAPKVLWGSCAPRCGPCPGGPAPPAWISCRSPSSPPACRPCSPTPRRCTSCPNWHGSAPRWVAPASARSSRKSRTVISALTWPLPALSTYGCRRFSTRCRSQTRAWAPSTVRPIFVPSLSSVSRTVPTSTPPRSGSGEPWPR